MKAIRVSERQTNLGPMGPKIQRSWATAAHNIAVITKANKNIVNWLTYSFPLFPRRCSFIHLTNI